MHSGDDEPSPSFKGGLNKFIHTPLQHDTKAAISPTPSPTKSLKRKLEGKQEEDENGDEAKSPSKKNVTGGSVKTESPRRRISPRSKSKTPTQSPQVSPSKRTSTPSRSKNNRTNRADGAVVTSSLPIWGGGRGGDGAGEQSTSLLRDTIPPNLVLVLIGVNPGIMTGQTGYAYAHPTNLYWRLLHSSGITAYRHPPSDTYRLPELYSVGNTNIVTRPTRDASMLSRAEMNAGVAVLEEKVALSRPEAVCLVGKSIWETVWRVRKGKNIKKEEFKYGWQDEGENMGRVGAGAGAGADGDGTGLTGPWNGARVFVATTTSGLAAGMKLPEKEAVWNELGSWVKERREARGFVLPTVSEALKAN